MKIYSPLFIFIRILLYSFFMYGIAQGIYFDAAYPMEDGYFGEITFTEITQEVFLFILFLVYLFLGHKKKGIQPIANLIAIFYLMSFIREFNFLISHWIYPVLAVFAVFVWLFIRDFKKIKNATIEFFRLPPSSWFFSGLLITYIFSRLMGRSDFWRLLYEGENYRLAKAATEESIELLGCTIMIIGAIEFLLFFNNKKRQAE